jgi:GntR family transcriptional repressor for pyruvate dehydrogenase complex
MVFAAWSGGGRVALTDEAIDKIKGMIISGELGPGDRLPKEADLAERLGLSRNSLREAVKALSMIRVLDVRQGDGTYVTSLEPNLLLDALSFVVDFHRDDKVLQFLEVRRILEPAATALAAERMTDDGVAHLQTILDRLGAEPTIEALVENDLEFHRQIAAGSENDVLCSLIDGLSGPTTRARIWRGLTQEGAADRTREQHQAIVDAIAARQPDVARSWATVHIAGVEQWLRSAL